MNLKQSIAIGLAAAPLFASFGCGGGGEKKTTASPPAAQTKQEKPTLQPKQEQKQPQEQKQQQPQEQQELTVKNKLENVVLEVTGFRMPGGKVELFTTISNNSGEGVTIKEAVIAVEFYESNGSFMGSDWGKFDNVNLYIPAGEERRHTFTMVDPKCPHFEGYANYRYEYLLGK